MYIRLALYVYTSCPLRIYVSAFTCIRLRESHQWETTVSPVGKNPSRRIVGKGKKERGALKRLNGRR